MRTTRISIHRQWLRPPSSSTRKPGFGLCHSWPGLIEELERHHIRITRERPDYVIVGETDEYDYAKIMEATLLIQRVRGLSPQIGHNGAYAARARAGVRGARRAKKG
jgi:hypothetical protein